VGKRQAAARTASRAWISQSGATGDRRYSGSLRARDKSQHSGIRHLSQPAREGRRHEHHWDARCKVCTWETSSRQDPSIACCRAIPPPRAIRPPVPPSRQQRPRLQADKRCHRLHQGFLNIWVKLSECRSRLLRFPPGPPLLVCEVDLGDPIFAAEEVRVREEEEGKKEESLS
jgi:hypothetical protein